MGNIVVALAFYPIKRSWDLLVSPIKRQCEYVFSSQSHAKDLQKEIGVLAYQADWVHMAMEEATKKIYCYVYPGVANWHESAETALKKARELLETFKKASKTCCHGILPDPSCHYQFSRTAMGKIEGIQRLTRDCKRYKEFNDIYFAPGDHHVFESQASTICNIMDALANDSISVVGVYGMGAVGKSTILNIVKKIVPFDWIATVDVSDNPDIRRIQDQIASTLGLTGIRDKVAIRGRAEFLHKRLEEEIEKKNKGIIILENLWERLDLQSIGIPCDHNNNIKLLLASRDCNVLQCEMGCDKVFRLGGLKKDEAKRLFEKTMGDKVHDDEFKSWVKVALDKCAGVPLLIITMANHFRHVGLYRWEVTLIEIEKYKHSWFHELLKQMLQRTYDRLDEEEKLFLQHCVIYGDSELSFENFTKYGVDLGLVQEGRSEEALMGSWRSLIRTFRGACFLSEDVNARGFKIHDLVREFVISIASRDQVTEYLRAKGTYRVSS